MPVPTSIADLSAAIASNSPSGSDVIGTAMDDYLRATAGILKQMASAGTDIASASTITIPNDGSVFQVTGVTTITAIANAWTGRQALLRFAGVLQLTHNGSSFVLPGAANITTAAGDWALFVQTASGVWRCALFGRASGEAIIAPFLRTAGGTVTGDVNFTGAVSIDGVEVTATPAELNLLDGKEALGYTLKGITTYTTGSGTYTVPTGAKALYVECYGAGGGGGGVDGQGTGKAGVSGAGGGGAYCAKLITGTLEASYSYAVGAGGAGGVAGANNGSTGGTSTFAGGAVSLSAAGGTGGGGVTADASATGVGGSGGTATGGDVNLDGGFGGVGLVIYVSAPWFVSIERSGTGAGPLGGSARKNNYEATGVDGQAPGGGGGGTRVSPTTTSNYAGGAGGAGMVRISEYY